MTCRFDSKPICPECDGSGRVRRIDGKDICDICHGGQ